MVDKLVEQVARWLYEWEDFTTLNRPPFDINDWEEGARQIINLVKPVIEQEVRESVFRNGFEFAQTTRLDGMKHLLCYRCRGVLDGTIKVD